MNKKPVILDCDPGHDDVMAIILAAKSNILDLKLITTVSGNTSVDMTTENTLNVLNYIGCDQTPVAKGFNYLYLHPYEVKGISKEGDEVIGAGVHGKTGLDGFTFPNHNLKIQSENPIHEMAKVILDSKDKVTIIATGPLTNIAILLRSYPEVKSNIEKVSMMGGACDYILLKPFMEFNTYTDPEATNIVLESGLQIDMYTYDVTYSVLYSDVELEKIKGIKNNTSKMVYDLLYEFRSNHNSSHLAKKFGNRAPIHDALAVAGVIDNRLILESEKIRCDVELAAKYMRGATVFDRVNKESKPLNVNLIKKIDNKEFFELFYDCIRKCN